MEPPDGSPSASPSASSSWPPARVREWVAANGFAEVGELLEKDEVDGEALPLFTVADFQEYGMAKGPAIKLARRAGKLPKSDPARPSETLPETPADVEAWIAGNGYPDAGRQMRDDEIDGEVLSMCTPSELLDYGIRRGPAMKLIARVRSILEADQQGAPEPVASAGVEDTVDEEPDDPAPAAALEDDVLRRQMAVREALHRAVEKRDAAGLASALEDATGLLLEAEVRWAVRELKVIQLEDSEREAVEAARVALRVAAIDDLSEAIVQAREVGLPAEELTRAEQRFQELLDQESRRKDVEAAQEEVAQAISFGDVQALVTLLAQHDAVLPAEQAEAARHKIPAMLARAEIRKELAAAMRDSSDISQLRCALWNAKRSTLPQWEIAAAESALQEAVAARKGKKARAAVGAAASPLEKAVQARDVAEIRTVLAELQAKGMSAAEISELHTQALAKFGVGE